MFLGMEVLNLKEAADLLRITTRTLRDLVNQGQVPGAKVGGSWRFSRALLMKQLAGPSSDVVEETTTTTIRKRG